METDPYGLALKYLLEGDAVLFVGSGASAEMGYPSWIRQVEILEEYLAKHAIKLDEDIKNYKDADGKLPSAFEVIERAIGRERMLTILSETLVANKPEEDSIYNSLTACPFGLFLTTNFDDEVANHLRGRRKGVVVYGNAESDFSHLTDTIKDAVFKIHGSLTDFDNAVVTQKDYDEFSVNPSRRYFRVALDAIVRRRKIVIVGYSLKDPDIRYVLMRAKSDGFLRNQICMFVADMTPQEKRELLRQMNVVALEYANPDGTHVGLRKVIATLKSFINPGSSNSIHTEDSRNAASLYVFRTLSNRVNFQDHENYVLLQIPPSDRVPITRACLAKKLKIDASSIDQALASLEGGALITNTENGCLRTKEGDAYIEKCTRAFEDSRDLAFKSFVQDLGVALTSREEVGFRNMVERAVAAIFDARGLALARQLFNGCMPSSGELSDMYSAIMSVASEISDNDKKWQFVQSVRRFILNPTEHQKEYLVAMAQGFFLYHLAGCNDAIAKVRKDFIKNSEWFIDSHIVQALAAPNCEQHELVKALIQELKSLKVRLYVTESTLAEVENHLNWAIRAYGQVGDKGLLSLIRDRYNFFIDGYIQSKAKDGVASFEYYIRGIRRELADSMSRFLSVNNIQQITYDKKNDKLCDLFDQIRIDVRDIRIKKDRVEPNDRQICTDAEIYVTIIDRMNRYADMGKERNVYFLSDSTVFDRMETRPKRWTAYNLYRFIRSFPAAKASTGTLWECMHCEMIGAGVRIVDSQNYAKFFAEEINTAKLKYDEEREIYVEQLEKSAGLSKDELDARFAEVPDSEKSIFVGALDLAVAKKERERADEEVRRRLQIEKSARDMEEENARRIERINAEKDLLEKKLDTAKQALAAERNRKDSKYVARKRREAKKNRRKSRKR